MPSKTTKNRSVKPSDNWIINEEADQALIRIMKKFGGITLLVLVLLTGVMGIVNVRGFTLYPWHKQIDFLAIFIVLVPFYIGIHQLFATRLNFGRDLVNTGKWKQAVASLDAFAVPGQRFLDGTGEAHYLLARAYAGIKENDKAEAARQFVLKYRKGVWATELENGISAKK